MNFEQLLGPVGLTVGAVAVALALWREHLRADADDRKQRDIALEGWKAQTDANAAAAAAAEKDAAARLEASRRGRTDDPS